MKKNSKPSLRQLLRYGNFKIHADRRLDAAKKLLNRSTNGAGPDETLQNAYLRRSLDVIEHPERFMALAALAPDLAEDGLLRRRFAKGQYAGGDGFRKQVFDLMIAYHGWFSDGPAVEKQVRHYLEPAFRSVPGTRYLGINTHEGIAWFSRERYGDFLFRMYAVALIGIHVESVDADAEEARLFDVIGRWTEARHSSLFQVERLLRSRYLDFSVPAGKPQA